MSENKFLASFDRVLKGLNQEKAETHQMMQTFLKVLTQKLPNGEKPENQEIHDAVEQLKDVHKMAGLTLFAVLPGSVITLPAICALGRRFGVEILPSAFQKNSEDELDDGKTKPTK